MPADLWLDVSTCRASWSGGCLSAGSVDSLAVEIPALRTGMAPVQKQEEGGLSCPLPRQPISGRRDWPPTPGRSSAPRQTRWRSPRPRMDGPAGLHPRHPGPHRPLPQGDPLPLVPEGSGRTVQSHMAVKRASGSRPLASASLKIIESASLDTAAQTCSRYSRSGTTDCRRPSRPGCSGRRSPVLGQDRRRWRRHRQRLPQQDEASIREFAWEAPGGECCAIH